MAESVLKSDFLNKATEVAKELSAMIESAQDGKHRAIIVLAAEEVAENSSANVIGISGRSKEAASALHDFATQSPTKWLFRRVATHVALENLSNK